MDFFLALLFSDSAAPATNGRRAIAPPGQCDPHQPAVGQLFLAIVAAARGDRTRPPAPLSNGVNVDSTRLERAPLLLPRLLSLSDFGIYLSLGEGAARQYEQTRRLLTNRPVLKLCRGESYSKGRLRVSNGLCSDSMIMQSMKPSNSDF